MPPPLNMNHGYSGGRVFSYATCKGSESSIGKRPHLLVRCDNKTFSIKISKFVVCL